MQSSKFWVRIIFAVCITLISFRAYQYPEYSSDGLSYIANAVAMKGSSILTIHDTVYREAKTGIPQPIFDHLIGDDPSEPASESNSFRDRSRDPYHFAEFLPCFAIRPIFNELLYALHFWLGIGLLKAVVIIPVLSYWLMGWIALAWASRFIASHWAALITVLLFLSPPLWDLARSTTPDALSSLAVLSAMFLLFEWQKLFPGTLLLLASVYVRTDNALLALIVLGYLCVAGYGMKPRETAILSATAIASVVLINYFAGDYGSQVLYYRSFIEPPVAVGEIVPRFGIHEYFGALRTGIAGALHGPYIPFLLMGMVGLRRSSSQSAFALATTTAFYTATHLLIFPNPETRFFGPFFIAMGLALTSTERSAFLFSLNRKPQPNFGSITTRGLGGGWPLQKDRELTTSAAIPARLGR